MAEAETRAAARSTEVGEDRLVSGLRKADPGACACLCEQFGPRIHKFTARHVRGDGQLAEEMMVQTLVDAVRNIGRFDPRRSQFSAWLFGIARRQVQGELRRQSRRKSVPASAQVSMDVLVEQAGPGDMAAAVASRLDAQRQVARLTSYLSDIEMEVLMLHCMDQLSLKEIAQIMGRSERAINSLLHRARQKARERLVNDD